jgi:hypothetical protein
MSPFECTTPLSQATRPDLAYALQQLSQFLHNPGPAHWRAAKRVLRYLKGTQSLGITFGGRDSTSNPFISAYVDASYAMCLDTRRCVGVFSIPFFGNLVSWMSKKQSIVTLSTTEAEFVALALCIQEYLYIRQLAAELHLLVISPSQSMRTTNLPFVLLKMLSIMDAPSTLLCASCVFTT